MTAKKAFFVAVLVISILCVPLFCFAYDMPDSLRVGLSGFNGVSSVSMKNDEIEIGSEYDGIFHFETSLTASDSFSINVYSGNMVDVNEFYGGYEAAVRACADVEKLWGYTATPAYVDVGLWGVYVCGIENPSAVANNVNGSVLQSASHAMVLKDGEHEKIIFNGINPQISSSEGTIDIGSEKYRGLIEFGRYNGGSITTVNVLEMDSYLYGVVPKEMPFTWEMEALKAQAVAARTYTISFMGRHSSDGYDVCDKVHCQSYGGYKSEEERTNSAVDSTSSVAAYYDGKPINAVFFSSSGGATDNSENVWVDTVPYLRGVPEINETNVSTWTRTYTAGEMKNILSSKGINIGNILDVSITEATEYGRVQEVTVTGTSGSKILTKEETRTIFSGTSQGSLPSRMYTINGKGGAVIKEDSVEPSGDKGNIKNDDASSGKDANVKNEGNGNNKNDESASNEKNDVSKSVFIQSSDGTKAAYFDDIFIIDGNGGEAIEGKHVSEPVIIGGEKGMKIGEATEFVPNENNVFAAAEEKFVFYGKGNGHGVGMSQYGANGMAKAGYKYDEILEHYYTGITVE